MAEPQGPERQGPLPTEPEAGAAPRIDPIPQQLERLRAQAAETGRAARRTLDRVGWATVIGVAIVNVTIGLVVWRLAVRRERRHKRRVQLWVEDVLGERMPRERRLGRIRRVFR